MKRGFPRLAELARRHAPSRREVLKAAAVAGLCGAVSTFAPASARRRPEADLGPFLPRLREMRKTLWANARPWALGVADGKLARKADDPAKPDDRHTYTVDVGQMMWYAAMAADEPAYVALRDFAAANLIVDDPTNPFVRGFVLWRHNPGKPPDASGTTEALRLVRALWAGAKTLNRPEDAELALTILDGYRRHQSLDQGIWFICNYFNFGNRSFATNSFIIDYDADLVREVADEVRGNKKIEKADERAKQYDELAANSYRVMRRAVTPCGLMYDLLQPELKTMYYEKDVSCFSPNDIVQLNNACTTAATVARGDPGIGHGVLAFLMTRADERRPAGGPDGAVPTTTAATGPATGPSSGPVTAPAVDRQHGPAWPAADEPARPDRYEFRPGDEVPPLYVHYYGQTGRRATNRWAAAPEFAAISRLAALLGHRQATALFVDLGVPYWERTVTRPVPEDVWTVTELLLTFEAVLDMKA